MLKEVLGKIEKRDDFHWGNVVESETNPSLIAAIILIERGFPISLIKRPQAPLRNIRLRPVEDLDEPYDDWIEIFTYIEGARALHKIDNTPEMYAFEDAYSGVSDSPPDFEYCAWDNTTIRKIEAFFWQNRARYFQEWAQYNEQFKKRAKVDLLEQKKGCEAKAKEVLGELPLLTPDDIRSLLEQVVDRELTQPPQSS